MRQRVNVLVGLAAAGLLAGLALAAVGRVQHAKQVSICKNHLKQLGIGLSAYYDCYGYYPPAVVPGPDLPPDRRLSWLFILDPFVHARMDPTWKFDRSRPWDAEENLRLAYPRMPWYVCPAAAPQYGAGGLTHSSYVGVAGVGADAAALPAGDPRAGLFGYERTTNLKDVADGPGEMAAVIETDVGTGPWTAGGPPTTRGLDLGRPPFLGPGRPFGGTHKGGANVLFVDGSARFVRDTTGPGTLEALFTVAAGDRPDPFKE
jgi:prepilin-type processing-associated H-X9-DG protein